jgi:hypothetical protein
LIGSFLRALRSAAVSSPSGGFGPSGRPFSFCWHHDVQQLFCRPYGGLHICGIYSLYTSPYEPNAYRNVPSQHPEYNVAAVVSPRSGQVFFFAMRGHAFGFSASPPNYCQKSTLLCISAACLLAVPVAPYVDDFTVADSELSRGQLVEDAIGWQQYPGSAQAGLWNTSRWLCSDLADDKSRSWAQVSSSCGCTTDFLRTHITGEVYVGVNPSSQLN